MQLLQLCVGSPKCGIVKSMCTTSGTGTSHLAFHYLHIIQPQKHFMSATTIIAGLLAVTIRKKKNSQKSHPHPRFSARPSPNRLVANPSSHALFWIALTANWPLVDWLLADNHRPKGRIEQWAKWKIILKGSEEGTTKQACKSALCSLFGHLAKRRKLFPIPIWWISHVEKTSDLNSRCVALKNWNGMEKWQACYYRSGNKIVILISSRPD